MAITYWQLITAVCCILLETGSVLSKTFENTDSNSFHGRNYPAAYMSAAPERKSSPSLSPAYGSEADYAAPISNAASAADQYAAMDLYSQQSQRSQQQPKVYESTESRLIGPARQASTVQASTTTVGDLNTAAGHHHGHHHHGKYYEYREVPKKKTWKFGYKRGNHKHHIERHEHGKAGKHPHFKTKVKWADKKSKGKGIHLWDYNHHDKKHYHHHGR